MARPIPVRNLYYMFCYAWDMFEEGRELVAGAEDARSLPELVAHVMDGAVRTLLRRGLDQGYAERADVLTAPRGRIDVPGSLALRARHAPALACRVDERSPDVPHSYYGPWTGLKHPFLSLVAFIVLFGAALGKGDALLLDHVATLYGYHYCETLDVWDAHGGRGGGPALRSWGYSRAACPEGRSTTRPPS